MKQAKVSPESPEIIDDLVDGMRRGSTRALKRTYEMYSNYVFGIALKILGNVQEAEEVTQDVFVKVWKNIQQFDSKRSELRGWIYIMCRSASIDRLRKRKSRPDQLHEKSLEFERMERSQMVHEPHRLERRDKIDESLSQLRPEYRRSLELAYFKGYTQREIAEELEVPEGTAKSFLRRGLTKLREVFNSHD